jgi:hypothetical protein
LLYCETISIRYYTEIILSTTKQKTKTKNVMIKWWKVNKQTKQKTNRVMNGYLKWNTINVNDISNYWCSLSMNSVFSSATKILYGVRIMVFKATFNNISVISWRSVLLLEEPGVPGENNRPVANHWQILSHNVVSSHTRNEADSNSQFYWW